MIGMIHLYLKLVKMGRLNSFHILYDVSRLYPVKIAFEFVSGLRRNIFYLAKKCFMHATIEEAVVSKTNTRFSNESLLFVGVDSIISCQECSRTIDIRNESTVRFILKRPMKLHEISHGSLPIYVRDLQCPCGSIVRYDGYTDWMFYESEHHAFFRELMNSCMFDVCRLGFDFRESFDSWKKNFRIRLDTWRTG